MYFEVFPFVYVLKQITLPETGYNSHIFFDNFQINKSSIRLLFYCMQEFK